MLVFWGNVCSEGRRVDATTVVHTDCVLDRAIRPLVAPGVLVWPRLTYVGPVCGQRNKAHAHTWRACVRPPSHVLAVCAERMHM